MGLRDIKRHTDELVEKIRDYSRSQRSTWRLVPSLALQADGRTGYNDEYNTAYTAGYWPIHSSIQSGYYTVFVDLESGELMAGENTPALDSDVLKLVDDVEELNANRVVRSLQAHAAVPYAIQYDGREQYAWRRKLRKDLQLKEAYTRDVKKKAKKK